MVEDPEYTSGPLMLEPTSSGLCHSRADCIALHAVSHSSYSQREGKSHVIKSALEKLLGRRHGRDLHAASQSLEPLVKQLVLRPPEGRAGPCLPSGIPWHISLSAVIGGITREKMRPLFSLSSFACLVECL